MSLRSSHRSVALAAIALWASSARADIPPPRVPLNYVPAPWPKVPLPEARHTQSPLLEASPPTTPPPAAIPSAPPSPTPAPSDNAGDRTPIDVRMLGATLTADLHPAFQRVHQTLRLRGGARDAMGLVIGLPVVAATAYDHVEGRPLEDLAVRIDGRRIAPRFVGGRVCRGEASRVEPQPSSPSPASPPSAPAPPTEKTIADKARGLRAILSPRCDDPTQPGVAFEGRGQANDWWLFSVDVPAGREIRVDIDYAQLTLGERHGDDPLAPVGAFAVYRLFSGGPWSGPIGEVRLAVRPRGVPADRIEITARAPTERRADALVWIFRDLEPALTDNVSLRARIPVDQLPRAEYAVAPYLPPGVPLWLRLVDHRIRLLAAPAPTPRAWSTYIQSLRLAADQREDPRARAEARLQLAELRTWLVAPSDEIPDWMRREKSHRTDQADRTDRTGRDPNDVTADAPRLSRAERRVIAWLTPSPASDPDPTDIASDPRSPRGIDGWSLADRSRGQDRWSEAARASLFAAADRRFYRSLIPIFATVLVVLITVAAVLVMRRRRRTLTGA